MIKDFEIIPVYRGVSEIKPIFKLLKTTKTKAWILGGYVRYMCSPTQNPIKAGDVDIYCRTKESFEIHKTKFSKYLSVYNENPISITFIRPKEIKNPFFRCPTIQLIKPLKQGAVVTKGSLTTILNNFDFSVVRLGIHPLGKVFADKDYLKDEKQQILRIKNIHCPISSLFRCIKYQKKGYHLPAVEILKLFRNWEQRTETYKSEIEKALNELSTNKNIQQEQIDKLEKLMRID
jgi:hypothetical protein